MMQLWGVSLTAGATATVVTHPFEFLKTKIQLCNEGIGIHQKGMAFGYNPVRLFTMFHEAGYGARVLFTG